MKRLAAAPDEDGVAFGIDRHFDDRILHDGGSGDFDAEGGDRVVEIGLGVRGRVVLFVSRDGRGLAEERLLLFLHLEDEMFFVHAEIGAGKRNRLFDGLRSVFFHFIACFLYVSIST